MQAQEISSGNVYADLEQKDAEMMQLKAQLCLKIEASLLLQGLSQRDAAKLTGVSQAKFSNMLRGEFRGISEAKMMQCLTRLGHSVQIRVSAKPIGENFGQLAVV